MALKKPTNVVSRLADVALQPEAVAALQRALRRDALPGGVILSGPPGVGKSTVAAAFAVAAACLEPSVAAPDACGSCRSCRAGLSNPDILRIAPAGERTQIAQLWTRDGSREPGALSGPLRFAPALGRRRVIILEAADTLTEQAANSLLKVLEEPPHGTLFVLSTSHPGRLLATVASRCATVALRPVAIDELAAWLETMCGVEPATAPIIAALADGLVGRAATIAANEGVGTELEAIAELGVSLGTGRPLLALREAERLRALAARLKALPAGEARAASEHVDAEVPSTDRAGRRQYGALLDVLTAFYRDVLAAAVRPESPVRFTASADRIRAIAASSPPTRWTRCLDAIQRTDQLIAANVNVGAATDVLAIELMRG